MNEQKRFEIFKRLSVAIPNPTTELKHNSTFELLIAVISDRGRLLIASGSHILSPQDEVIVICHPKHRSYLEQIF